MNSSKETDNKGVIIGAEQAVRTGMAKGRDKKIAAKSEEDKQERGGTSRTKNRSSSLPD